MANPTETPEQDNTPEMELPKEAQSILQMGGNISSAFASAETQIHHSVSHAFAMLAEVTEHVTNKAMVDQGVPMPPHSVEFWKDQEERAKQMRAEQEAHKAKVIADADKMLGTEEGDSNGQES